MATVKQAEFNTQNAIKSISDLKDMVKKLRSEMEQLTIGTDEYKEKAEQLAGAQQQLTSVQQYAQKGLVALQGSYNAISYEMSELKKQYHATADEAERADLAKKINNLNDQLKEMDANVGVFSRNVGNYQSAFEALGNQGMGAVTKGMSGIKGAADILVKHPIIAIIAIVLTTIMKIADAVKKNEEAMNKLKVAFAPLNAVMDVFKNVLDIVTNKIADLTIKLSGGLTKAIKTVIQWIARGAEALGMDGIAGALNEIEQKMEDNVAIAKEDLKLQQQRRDVVKQNAESERELAKLRKQFAEAEGNATKQAQLAKKIAAEEHAIRKRNYDLAKAEYDQIKLKNAQTQSGTADLDKENDAYARMVQAEAQLYALSSEQKKVIKQNATELKAVQSEVDKLVKSLEEWNAKYVIDNQTLEEAKVALQKKYEAELVILKDNEEAKKLLKKKYDAELLELDKKLADKQKKEAQEALKKLVDDTNTLLAEMIEQNTGDVLFSSVDKALRSVANNIMAQYANSSIDEEQTRTLLRALGIDEDAINEAIANIDLNKGLNQLKDGLNGVASVMSDLGSNWDGVVSKMIATIDSVQTALNSSEKGFAKWGNVAAASCQMVGQMFSALASEQDAQTEEGFQKQKELSTASAAMNMLAGIVSAWTSAMNPSNAWMTVYGQIAMGAAMSAMILGTGIAQIAQIQKQTLKGSGSVSSPRASTSGIGASITPPVQYSTTVDGASTEGQLDDNKIYVSVTEIEQVGHRVNVAEGEARY